MVQVLKGTKYFELFGSLNPGTVRVSTENSKDEVILGRCAIYSPATALFSFNAGCQEDLSDSFLRAQPSHLQYLSRGRSNVICFGEYCPR